MQNQKIQELVDLKKYTTFRMGGQARWFFVVQSVEELKEAYQFALAHSLPVFILGSGSNILISPSNLFEAVVVKMEIPGFEVVQESGENIVIKVGAGEIWDDVVARAVESNWSGIEALSWIPGTAGATPIQNVGAYGSEIADVLVSLEAYEIATKRIISLTKEQCEFKYRDSVFKHEGKDKYVTTSVTLRLSKEVPTPPNYPGVKKYFDEHNIENPTLNQIREAIISIRDFKLPDPKNIASVGSFFKNPFVNKEHYEQLKESYPAIVAFLLENGDYKISAGWLLETLGYKGKQFGNLQFYSNNALVLTNINNANYEELEELVNKTKAHVKQTFGIDLEIEPIVI